MASKMDSMRNDPRFPGNPKEIYLCDSCAEDDIVITGMSGRFPQTDNIKELMDGLFANKILYKSRDIRWGKTHMTQSSQTGLLNDISKFDGNFFDINSSYVQAMNPQERIMLEVCHETIVDAGYDPEALKGRNIGVFIGINDPDIIILANKSKLEISKIFGYSTSLTANGVAHYNDFFGVSATLDTACSSSLVALDFAVASLKMGSIEAAIVGGCKLIVDPESNNMHIELGILSANGECRPFEARNNGMVRSEAATSIFLQKAKDARRVYAKVLGVKSMSSGNGENGIFHPREMAQTILLKSCMDEVNINPNHVHYIETHGTGTRVGDPTEIKSLEEAFCVNRKEPLLIGSIKSNIGHTEASAGICGIVKAVIAFETGMIPPHADFIKPNTTCEALIKGKIKVVVETTPMKGNYIGVSSFGVGGTISHVILEKIRLDYGVKDRDHGLLSQIVLYGATTESALKNLFGYVQETPLNREFFALLHKSAYNSIQKSTYRGYTILNKNNQPISAIEGVKHQVRQVWFIVTGMGCQWSGMALDLMHIDVFANSMRHSAKVLAPLGIDLLELLNPEKDYLRRDRHITSAFVTISAIQIALVDVLKELGIEPDGFVGHSTGELVCGYIDGCATAEQTILSAYYRGFCVESSNLPRGEMAAVGLSWEEARARCPEGVFAACHNAQDSVTISGKADKLESFVRHLQAENVFARKVNTYGYAFHSPEIASAGPILKSELQKVYVNPKPRSHRWISSSYEEKHWETPECKIADANYFAHNLMSPVQFYKAISKIPSDAITIEIGPHALLQSILKRAIGLNATHIGLMKRNENNINFLLSSIGQLYTLGLNPQVQNLYPPVSYPVPRGTPMISSLIEWDHSRSWFSPKPLDSKGGNFSIEIEIDMKDRYLLDHCIDGRPLFPAMGYVWLAWKAMCKALGKYMADTPIVIENMKILSATILNKHGNMNFDVDIQLSGGNFEICDRGSMVATGKIYCPTDPMVFDAEESKMDDSSTDTIENSQLYSELKVMGYEYGRSFQCIQEIEINGSRAYLKWKNEWIPFLDSMLLLFNFGTPDTEFKLPTAFKSLRIDPVKHLDFTSKMGENDKGVPVCFNAYTQVCSSPGVEITSLRMEVAPRRSSPDSNPVIEEYRFVPHLEYRALLPASVSRCAEYIGACFREASALPLPPDMKNRARKAIQTSSGGEATSIFDSSDEKHVLLSALLKIRSILKDKGDISEIESTCQTALNDFGKDLLYQNLLEEVPLRSLLDIVLENCSGRPKVVEVCDGGPPLTLCVYDMLNTLSQSKLNFTFVHSNSSGIDESEFISKDIRIESISKVSEDETRNGISGNLTLGSFVHGSIASLNTYVELLAQLTGVGGFVLLAYKHERTHPESFLSALGNCSEEVQPLSVAEDQFKKVNLTVVAKKCGPFGSCVYLLRKCLEKGPRPKEIVVPILGEAFDQWMEPLKTAMSSNQEDDGNSVIWLVAADSPTNGVIGMVNCLRQEPGGEKIRCIFRYETDPSSLPKFDVGNEFYADILQKDLLMNVYRNGCWGSFRHVTIPEGESEELTEYAAVRCSKIGDLSSFAWCNSANQSLNTQTSEFVQCHVYYAALNFKDVMLATGKIMKGILKNDVGHIGYEFSGRDSLGRKVFGLSERTSLGTTTLSHPDTMYQVPENWSMEEAATINVVYSTAYYALIDRGRLCNGEKVLIHSGAGGVGQAAIRIALHFNCEIFTTVGTEEKKSFLLKTFPQIKAENIGYSRDTTFQRMVMNRTKGEGVDVVLNSLADDKFQASIQCLGINGRFLEIGKYDMAMDHTLGLHPFLKNLTFISVMMDFELFDDKRRNIFHQKVAKFFAEGIPQGFIQPLISTVFGSEEVEKAFRYMASGKHIGKVLVKIRDEEPDKLLRPSPMRISAIKQLHLYPSKVYVIIGGLGGFGIELTKWLIRKGARHIILTSRYGARTAYHHLCMKRWKVQKANVMVSTLNVVRKESTEKLLQEASKYGPVGGIFNSALVLRDGFIEDQTAEKFDEVCAPKALATKHLDELSRRLCPSLDIFVCFSSISCGKGNAGQANYGYANSVMERICEDRRRYGFPGLAIQWGIIGDVGIVHRQVGEDAMISGVVPQRIRSCLDTLERFLVQERPVVSSFVRAKASKTVNKSEDMLLQLTKMFNYKDITSIDENREFKNFGIDSIFVVELRQLLFNTTDINFTVAEIQNMTLKDLKLTLGKVNKGSIVQKQTAVCGIQIISSPNLTTSAALFPLNDQKKGSPLIILHGNDLLLDRLRSLGSHIKRPLYGVRCTQESPKDSLDNLVRWYEMQIRKVASGNPVSLVGCSTGGILAIEIALRSEKLQDPINIRSVSVLDASLELMEVVNAAEEKKPGDRGEQEAADLAHFVSRFSDTDESQLESDLKSFAILNGKLKYLRDLLTSDDSVTFDKSNFIEAAETYVNKQRLIRSFHIENKLKKDLLVIEAVEKVLSNDVSVVKTFMSKLCSGKIDIHRLAGGNEFPTGESSAAEIAKLLQNI